MKGLYEGVIHPFCVDSPVYLQICVRAATWICNEAAAQKEENYEKESRKFTRSYGSRSYCSGRMRIQ